MALPWVRLDTNIASHDKMLGLLEERPAAGAYQAAFSYVCSLAYSGLHESSGLIVFSALPFVHGSQKTAHLLVKHQLWKPDPLGWIVANWENRQPSAAMSQHVRNVRRAAAVKGNCRRWHGPACNCWEDSA
jgi:hypothetical protein